MPLVCQGLVCSSGDGDVEDDRALVCVEVQEEPGALRVRHIATERPVAPEGIAAGSICGALVGSVVAWLAATGVFVVPGVDPLVAAGPLMASLAGPFSS